MLCRLYNKITRRSIRRVLAARVLRDIMQLFGRLTARSIADDVIGGLEIWSLLSRPTYLKGLR